MKTVDKIEFWEEDVYTVTKSEALEMLAASNITKSEQMLLRWCREDKIDAIRIVGVSKHERKILINKLSLTAFISSRIGPEAVEKLYIRIYQLEEEKREYEARIAFLESKLNVKKGK